MYIYIFNNICIYIYLMTLNKMEFGSEPVAQHGYRSLNKHFSLFSWLKQRDQRKADSKRNRLSLDPWSLLIGSMYVICTYIWLIFMVNVGKYPVTMDPIWCPNCRNPWCQIDQPEVKITNEAPQGLRMNLEGSYLMVRDSQVKSLLFAQQTGDKQLCTIPLSEVQIEHGCF